MDGASHLVQYDNSNRAGGPIQAGDKFDRAGDAMRIDMHFLDDRRRDVEKLNAKLHSRTLHLINVGGPSEFCHTACLDAIPRPNGSNGGIPAYEDAAADVRNAQIAGRSPGARRTGAIRGPRAVLRPLGAWRVSQHDLLTGDECANIAGRVIGLRPLDSRSRPTLTFARRDGLKGAAFSKAIFFLQI